MTATLKISYNWQHFIFWQTNLTLQYPELTIPDLTMLTPQRWPYNANFLKLFLQYCPNKADLTTLIVQLISVQAIRKCWNGGAAFQGQKDFVRPTRYFFYCFVAQIQKCHILRKICNYIYYENIFVISILASYRHSVRHLASLLEAQPPCERPSLPLRGPTSLSEAQPLCEMPGLPVRSRSSLWEAWRLCERPGF